MQRGLASYAATGARLRGPHFLGMLAETLARAGRVHEAKSIIDEALEALRESGERFSEAELSRVRPGYH
jgi:predicted ATPase